ncbi:VOC family protein [Roseitalea porphyridii]|uniref:VOC family protein n=1 Tax=Roseitalea porphyridii TaxID=1852022 RepID=A0A4P6V2M0_9HYPH|nr:VOC family protein [Roseitalea porphyridii]QBK30836.1 VOC family protein [Roseitalea porphyridii]
MTIVRPGYAAITPYLVCSDADAAIAWYARHLGATERYRLAMPGGGIAHAEIAIDEMVVMLSDAFPDMGIVAPDALGGSPVSLQVYVADADATFAAMVADGAEALFEVTDQFHGDRSGKLRDPFGHLWFVATNKEPLGPDEIVARFGSQSEG